MKKICFMSTCVDDWGGSEELWFNAAIDLSKRGHFIFIYKENINYSHPKIKDLTNAGVVIISSKPNIKDRLFFYLFRKLNKRMHYAPINKMSCSIYLYIFRKKLLKHKIDQVVISQAINFDGLAYANECFMANIPYSLIIQKAVDFYWPVDSQREIMKTLYVNSTACFFVSKRNKILTEQQLSIDLKQVLYLNNPIKTQHLSIPPINLEKEIHWACVGRLFIIDKGQDILLRILNKPKWRNRPLYVNFYGCGPNEIALKEMGEYLGLDKIRFFGFNTEEANIWSKNQALILASRSEGQPLSVLEAMAAGRIVIVTDVGENTHLVSDGITGFISEDSENSFELAMERAWNCQQDWHTIGQNSKSWIDLHFKKNDINLLTNFIHEN